MNTILIQMVGLQTNLRNVCRLMILVLGLATVTGCDPGGLRRVRLSMGAAQSAQKMTVATNTRQEALETIDNVLKTEGFRIVGESDEDQDHIRIYSLLRTSSSDTNTPARSVSVKVRALTSDIELTFGEFGFLAGQPEARQAWQKVRSALAKKYGEKNVKSFVR